ncbi:hypothetical protein GCM10018965_082020 [Nonomuraea roseola]
MTGFTVWVAASRGPGGEAGAEVGEDQLFASVVDLSVDVVLLAVNALGVDAQQDVHAVTSALGDLGSRDARVQPERDGSARRSYGRAAKDEAT